MTNLLTTNGNAAEGNRESKGEHRRAQYSNRISDFNAYANDDIGIRYASRTLSNGILQLKNLRYEMGVTQLELC